MAFLQDFGKSVLNAINPIAGSVVSNIETIGKMKEVKRQPKTKVLGTYTPTLPKSKPRTTVSQNMDRIPTTTAKTTTALSGTPTSTPPAVQAAPTLSPEQQKESDARAYLQAESAASQKMGSKNFVAALRGKEEPTANLVQRPGDTGGTMKSLVQTNPQGVQSSAGIMNALRQKSPVDAARQQVRSLASPSAQEASLQDELAQFRGDARMGIAGLEGQGRGIPLSLVRGQQAKLGEQAGIQEQTLLDRIAAASAQRQAALTAAQTDLGYMMQDQARQDALAQAAQERQDRLTSPVEIGGSLLQFDPATGQYKTLYTAPATAAEAPTSVQEYQFAVQNGYQGGYTDFLAQKAAASQNPANLQFVSPTSTFGGGVFDPNTGTFTPNTSTTQSQQASQLTTQALDLVNNLVNHPGLRGAVGDKSITSLFGILGQPIAGTPAADFTAQLERLKSLLSLENISYLKGTGAMSDREFATLASAAAALDRNMSDSEFVKELQRIQSELSTEVGGTSQGSGDDIDKFLDSFSNAGRALNGAQATGVQAAAALTSNYKPGSYGGQCGRFVNRLTGFKMGNTYESKMRYVDPSIGKTQPVQPGDVFVMPYKSYGHTGFVADGEWVKKSDGTYDIPVVDSNWYNTSNPEKVAHHYINSSKITGFARAPVNTGKVSFA